MSRYIIRRPGPKVSAKGRVIMTPIGTVTTHSVEVCSECFAETDDEVACLTRVYANGTSLLTWSCPSCSAENALSMDEEVTANVLVCEIGNLTYHLKELARATRGVVENWDDWNANIDDLPQAVNIMKAVLEGLPPKIEDNKVLHEDLPADEDLAPAEQNEEFWAPLDDLPSKEAFEAALEESRSRLED